MDLFKDIFYGLLDSINIINVLKITLKNSILIEFIFYIVWSYGYNYIQTYYTNLIIYILNLYIQNLLILDMLNKLANTENKNSVLYENIIIYCIMNCVKFMIFIYENIFDRYISNYVFYMVLYESVSILLNTIYYSLMTHNYYWNYSNKYLDNKIEYFCINWGYFIGYGLILTILRDNNFLFSLVFLINIINRFVTENKEILHYYKLPKNILYLIIKSFYSCLRYFIAKK